MSRFNLKSTKVKDSETMLCGEKNRLTNPEMELYAMVCAGTLSPTYYIPDTNDLLNRIKSRMKRVDPLFVAQLAVYVREKMLLRTLPQVLTVELAKIHRGDDLIRRLTRRVVQRADEITELLAYYVKANNHSPEFLGENNGFRLEKKLYKLSNQMKKGLKDVFESGKFNEYGYAKYNRKTDIRLRDALFLTHPKPKTSEMELLFRKIANDTLETPYTWETQLSEAGQTGRSKKEVWEEMVSSGKMGYMAMLRNLRNLLKEDVSDEVLAVVADRLENPEEVRKSKQLPFRFLSAYRSLVPMMRGYCYTEATDTVEHPLKGMLLDSLENAVILSADNMPVLDGSMLMAIDVSGSMIKPISEKSTVYNFDIGALMAMLANIKCQNSTIGMFGNFWMTLDDLPKEKPLSAVYDIYKREGEVGYSTNGYKVLEWALKNNKKFDKIMIFTDCQMYGGNGVDVWNRSIGIEFYWNKYSEMYPETKLYLFNLAPYGESPLDIKGNAYLISGWSNSIFDVIKNIEEGEKALDTIRKIVI